MDRKILSIMGVILILFAFQSCSSKPEQSLLKSYFHALSLDDRDTLASIALEPVDFEAESWEIMNVDGEEVIKPAALSELNMKEKDLQKQIEASVGITLDARDDLYNAQDNLERARTRAAKRAAQRKVDEQQAKYDEQYEKHKNLQKDFNEAKEAAAREEMITYFSLGQREGDLPTIRDFTGDVHFKEVDLRITGEAGTKDYKLFLRKYMLKDEILNLAHRGRWVIIKFVAN